MGTTLTGLWQFQKNGPLLVFHVGDSRLYRYRAGEFHQLTRDQTLYQQALEEGLTDNLPPRNMLLQAMGPYETVKPEVKPQPVQAGDLYMLCTDGLHARGCRRDRAQAGHRRNDIAKNRNAEPRRNVSEPLQRSCAAALTTASHRQ